MDILNFSSLKAVGNINLETHLEIHVENKAKPNSCPFCFFNKIYAHDKVDQIFFDTPMQGKPVILSIKRARFKCLSCGKTFREPLPDIDDKRLMTSRLKDYIQKRSMRETFAVVARETGLDEKTIRHVFDDYVHEQSQIMKFETPKVLGIDELKIVGSYRCMLTNIEKNTVFNMLPSRKKVDVVAYLKTLENLNDVNIVVMDMWKPYKDAAKEVIPHAKIVVDKFHIVKMANEALEKARKNIRATLEKKDRLKLKDERFVLLERRSTLTPDKVEKLENWIQMFPILGEAYHAKEQFFSIFDTRMHPSEAFNMIGQWQKGLNPSIRIYFEPIITATQNWMPEILNGFEYNVTNAYTESINRLAKDIQRMGRGYSFEVVRAKMIYDQKANEKTQVTIRKKVRKPKNNESFTFTNSVNTQENFETTYEVEHRYYGAHIPTLCDLLEQGHFD